MILFILLAFSKVNAQPLALENVDSLYIMGEYSKAIKILMSIEPKTEQVYLKLAGALQAKGNLKEAGTSYDSILKRNPGHLLTRIKRAKLWRVTGELNKADSIFSLLGAEYPGNSSFQYQLGLVKEQLQDSTAMRYFKNTIQLQPQHQDALFKLARNELKRREYRMATTYSLMGLSANPENVLLGSILAQSYYNLKLYKDAIPVFEKLIELDKGNEFVHSRLGFSYYQGSKFIKAINNYKKALDFEDRNPDTHFYLGRLYAITGDLEKSEIHLLRAIHLKNVSVDAEFLSLGLTYKLQEDYKKALENFNRALTENPGNERALFERAIAADNYFKDTHTRINYYKVYLKKYEASGTKGLIDLAKTRLKDLVTDQHLFEE